MFKKLSVCILVLSLAASILTGVTAAADNNADAGIQSQADWDGTVAEEFAGGDGSAQSPFLIETAAQLAKCVTYGGAASKGKYFMLANDIVINNDLSKATISWYETVFNNPQDKRTFNGTFDGNGYVISGLYYKNTSGNPANGTSGLFPAATKDTRIKNVGIVNSSFRSGYYAGAILGSVSLGNIQWTVNGYSDNYPSIVNCFVGEDVTVNAASAGGFIGVVYGNYNSHFSIHNCSFLGTLIGSDKKGFEAGDYWGLYLYITNTFSTETLNKSKRSQAKVSRVYTTADSLSTAEGAPKKLTEEQAKGEAAKANMSGLDFDKTWMTNSNAYPSLRVFYHPINYTVSFDLSKVEGTEVIADMTSSEGKVILPAAPEEYHWIKGNEFVSGEIEITEDTVIKAEPHKGGTATCKDKAVCEVCGESYGELSATHGETELENHKDADCFDTGYTGDKICKVCGAVVEQGKDIEKTSHEFEDGVCTKCGTNEDVSGDPVLNDDNGSSGNSDNEIPVMGETLTIILAILISAIYSVAAVLLLIIKKQMKIRI